MARFVFEDEAPAAPRFVFEDEPAPAPPVGTVEAGVRGAIQGASLGFGDEAAAAIDAALPSFLRNATSDEAVGQGQTYGERYKNARDYYRARNKAAEAQHGTAYTGGQIAGALASLKGLPVKGAPGVLSAAGQGAVQGIGYSEANDGQGLARDAALGGGVALAGHGAGAALGKAAQRVTGAAGRLLGSARGRALGQAAEDASGPVASLEGAARERAANAYRQMERINAALADPALPTAERAALEQLKQSPEYAALLVANAKSIAAAAPEALAEREAARQVASEARAALPSEIDKRAAELLKSTIKADVKSLAKSYGEPIAWAYGANKAAELLGADQETQMGAAAVAGLLGGRTRGGKAIRNRLAKPGNRTAAAKLLERTARRVQLLRRPVATGLPVLAIPGIVEDETP